MDMSGKVVLITGASRGIGAAAARAFAGSGAKVALLARSTGEIETLAAEIGANAIALPCDVSNYDDVCDAVAKTESAFGPLDVLIGNAGLLDPISHLATSPEWESLSAAVAGFSGLSVAALNGSCAGGALGMVLACDLRVSVPTAKFFYPVIKMGVLPQPSDPARLAALVGPAAAKRILLTGARIEAPEALAIGLIDCLSGDDLVTDVQNMISPALAADPTQVAAIKAMIAK